MGGLLTFILLVAIVAIVAYKVWGAVRRQTEHAWSEAATQLGLRYAPRSPSLRAWLTNDESAHHRMRGRVDGYPVAVDTFYHRVGRERRLYTGYRVAFPPLGLGLGMTRARLFSRLKTFFGGQDIEVGDAAFDRDIIVRGEYPERVAAFLTPVRRMAVHRFLAEYPNGVIADRWLRWQTRGLERRPGALTGSVRRMVDVARALAAPPPAALERALETQRAGNLGAAADLAVEAARSSPDVETLRTEAEVLYGAGRYDESAREFGRLAEVLPEDDQVARWRERAEDRRARDDPSEPDSVPMLDLDAAGPSAAEVAEALFDPSNLSFETTSMFEERYEGARVRWEGPLVRSSTYRSDLDFRNGPGTKALVRVHRLANDLYAGRDVEAVVELPPEAADVLATRRGELVSFTGRLVRCDPLMRNLYVAGGRLA